MLEGIILDTISATSVVEPVQDESRYEYIDATAYAAVAAMMRDGVSHREDWYSVGSAHDKRMSTLLLASPCRRLTTKLPTVVMRLGLKTLFASSTSNTSKVDARSA